MGHSMTGVGEGRITENGFDIHVLIRAVNHRYLNLQIRTPRGYTRFEMLLRKLVKQRLSRGKVDVFTEFFELPQDVGEIVLNRGLCLNYQRLASEISETMGIPNGLTAERILKMNDIITVIPLEEKDDIIADILTRTLKQALENLIVSRKTEGDYLIDDMRKHLEKLQTELEYISEYADRQPALIKNRLTESLRQLGETVVPDDNRLEQEILLWVVRADVTEEIIRLKAHFTKLESLFESNNAIGKELDFVIQEMHREVNTIGSKSSVIEINETIVSMKLGIEKLREQAQNLE